MSGTTWPLRSLETITTIKGLDLPGWIPGSRPAPQRRRPREALLVLAGRGFDLLDGPAHVETVSEQLNAIGTGSGDSVEEGSDAVEPGLRTLSDGDREVLARLQADEIAYVAEVIACGGATAMEDVRREVRAGYEQAFLDEYGDELAALGIEPLG